MDCIEGKFYRITPIDDSSKFFDLELLYKVGGKNPREEFKVAAYGIPIESALERVISFAVNQKLEGVVTLKQYLDEYKQQREQFRKEIFGL